tara:strand:- start:95 stop:199 length:105 start_codon:yes stop_codon:yes gene_type:complete
LPSAADLVNGYAQPLQGPEDGAQIASGADPVNEV